MRPPAKRQPAGKSGNGRPWCSSADLSRDSGFLRSCNRLLRMSSWAFPFRERDQRRHAPTIVIVRITEALDHPALLDAKLAPERCERNDDGDHAAPLAGRERRAEDG